MSTAVITTLHDPQGKIAPFLAQCAGDLAKLYSCFIVVATPATSDATLAALIDVGAIVTKTATRNVGESRRRALQLGVEQSQLTHFHYCDLDRLVHWWLHYPDELCQIAAEIELQAGYVAIGRTSRAFETHPQVQITAESLTNRLFSWLFGEQQKILDVTAGSCALSRQSAELILAHSLELTNGTDCEWPMIIGRCSDLPVLFWQTEGLEFETATFFGQAVYQLSDSAENWQIRTQLARASTEAAMRILINASTQ